MVVEVLRGPLPDNKRIRLVPNGGDREHEGDSESDDESGPDRVEHEGRYHRLDAFLRAWEKIVRYVGEHKEWPSELDEVYRRALALSATVDCDLKQLVAKHLHDELGPMGHLGDNGEQDSGETGTSGQDVSE